MRTGGGLAAECTLVFGTGLFFAEGSQNEGLDRFRFGRGESPDPALDQPVTTGARELAEEGNTRTHPRSACPSLGLPAHEPRAIGSRRREVSSRWMLGRYRSRKALTGEIGSGGVLAGVVVRGASASSLARGESPRRTEHEGDRGLRRDAKVKARRFSLVHRFQGCTSR